MGPCFRPLVGLLCAAVISCGCTASRLRNPFALAEAKAGVSAAQKGPADGKKTPAAADGIRRGQPSARDAAAVAKATAKPAPHDKATLALIERELRDVLPDEREKLRNELQNVSSDMVPYILQARRMNVKYQQQAQQLADASPAETATAPAGLGSANPWSQSTPASAAQTAASNPATGTAEGVQALTAAPVKSPLFGHIPVALPFAKPISPAQANAPAEATTPPAEAKGGVAIQQVAAVDVGRSAATIPPITGNLPPGTSNQAAAVAANAAAAPPLRVNYQPTNPANALPPDYLQLLVNAAEAETAQVKPGTTETEKQAYTERHVYLRMLYLMSGQQERALQAIPGLPPADQEFWQQTFWGIANYFDATAIPESADRATQTVAQLTTAVQRLQERAHLQVRNATFCQRISSFGNYERFPRDEFTPGQQVLLYAEVVNFHSEPAADGQFRTILKSTLEIHKPGPQGELIEKIQFPTPATEDLCRNHRRDYFQSYEFTIPPRIALGPHVLKLTVEDQLSRKVATYSLNFTVN